MDFVIVLVILALVVIFVSAPFRRTPAVEGASINGAEPAVMASQIAELEAARDAKYREIRDSELDHRTGKLSDIDYETLDSSLRAEAVEILHRLDTITKR
jgi:hypothetical protein